MLAAFLPSCPINLTLFLWSIGPVSIATHVKTPAKWPFFPMGLLLDDAEKHPPSIYLSLGGPVESAPLDEIRAHLPIQFATPVPAEEDGFAPVVVYRSDDAASASLRCLVRQADRGGFVLLVDYQREVACYWGDTSTDGPFCLLETALRALAGDVLLRSGGALWHGGSVVVDEKAYLFVGVSGAGKTTLTGDAPEGVYLSDDQSISWHGCLYGSPFSGMAQRRGAGIRAPLAAVGILSAERPDETKIERIASVAAAATQLARHVCAFEGSHEEADRALQIAVETAQSVPVFHIARHLRDDLSTVIAAIQTKI